MSCWFVCYCCYLTGDSLHRRHIYSESSASRLKLGFYRERKKKGHLDRRWLSIGSLLSKLFHLISAKKGDREYNRSYTRGEFVAPVCMPAGPCMALLELVYCNLIRGGKRQIATKSQIAYNMEVPPPSLCLHH